MDDSTYSSKHFIGLIIVWGLCSLIASCSGQADKWREAEEAQQRLDTFAEDLGYKDYESLKKELY